MADPTRLRCPGCGNELPITDDADRCSCSMCGSEYVVKRGNGKVSLSQVVLIPKIQTDADTSASELALGSLKVELQEIEERIGERKRELETSGELYRANNSPHETLEALFYGYEGSGQHRQALLLNQVLVRGLHVTRWWLPGFAIFGLGIYLYLGRDFGLANCALLGSLIFLIGWIFFRYMRGELSRVEGELEENARHPKVDRELAQLQKQKSGILLEISRYGSMAKK